MTQTYTLRPVVSSAVPILREKVPTRGQKTPGSRGGGGVPVDAVRPGPATRPHGPPPRPHGLAVLGPQPPVAPGSVLLGAVGGCGRRAVGAALRVVRQPVSMIARPATGRVISPARQRDRYVH